MSKQKNIYYIGLDLEKLRVTKITYVIDEKTEDGHYVCTDQSNDTHHVFSDKLIDKIITRGYEYSILCKEKNVKEEEKRLHDMMINIGNQRLEKYQEFLSNIIQQ